MLDDVRLTAPGTMTVKLVVAVAAGLKFAFPACVPCNVQMPSANSVIVVPLTPDDVQTVGVSDVTVTGRPDVAVADTPIGAVPNGRLGTPPNVIACAP